MKIPELLAPAGNLEKLKMALLYGADAVYISGKQFGLRSFAGNFTPEEMQEGIRFAHQRSARVYVTVNIFAHNDDLSALPAYLLQLKEAGADALIISDPGVLNICRQTVPEMELHLSTQANVTNWSSVLFWQQQGIKRIILARELSQKEIEEIRLKTDMDLEVFVHGALCISYSGRCLLSSYMAARDANKGECTQPCRWKYDLVEETRPGQYYPIEEDERGSYVFNAQDLCLLDYIPQLIKCGICSLKIEGRMKSVHYVATIVKAYRQALDSYMEDPEHYIVQESWRREIAMVSHRDYTTGFFVNRPDQHGQNYSFSSYIRQAEFVGLVLKYDPSARMILIEQRNKICIGDELEIVGPKHEAWPIKVDAVWDEEGKAITETPHPQMLYYLQSDLPVGPGDMLRRVK